MNNIDCLVVDIDGTLCEIVPRSSAENYLTAIAKRDIIEKVNAAYHKGIRIILCPARGMRSFNSNVDAIEEFHRPILESWLNTNGVLYHELRFGKPWDGNTYYLDDHALTLDTFLEMNFNEYTNHPSSGSSDKT